MEIDACQRRRDAVQLASDVMFQVSLSKIEIDEEFDTQDYEGMDYLEYLPWIMEDFPQLQKEKLAKHLYTYCDMHR